MPKGMTTQEVQERLEWLKHMPESGRDWGQGVLKTAEGLTKEIELLEKQRGEIAEEIRKRYRLLRSLPARADREVLLMGFTDRNVEKAKAQANGGGSE